MIKRVLMLNGPNLNLLGKREVGIYGNKTLIELMSSAIAVGRDGGIEVISKQFNSEEKMIDAIHMNNFDYIIANFAAYTHTSIALRDAILAIEKPFIEVHLSDISKREDFRKKSYFSDIADTVITGEDAYIEAVRFVLAKYF
jgi:3-dehydroquinate dehydratase-2